MLVLCLTFFVGCNTFDLDERWRPLEKIVERPPMESGDGIATTIGTDVYMANLDAFLKKNPPGSVLFNSLLFHEQIHSKRQLKMGLTTWLSKYGIDIAFMWNEERLGWYASLKNLRRRGWQIDVEAVARSLNNYKNLRGAMVSYEDALQWARDVISGKWQPAEEDKWSLPDWLQ